MDTRTLGASDQHRRSEDAIDPQLRGCPAAVPLTALSIEFVAKPEEAQRMRGAIPAAIRDALADVPGFAGCLVMIADREARLVSVVTFWTGADRITNCDKRERWLQRIIRPYIDHCLRVRTLDAYMPAIRVRWDGVGKQQSSLQPHLRVGETVEQMLVGVS